MVCINDALTDDDLREVLARLEKEKEEERDLFGLVCKRWLRLQSSESRRRRARAGPVMLRPNGQPVHGPPGDRPLSVRLENCKGVTDVGITTLGNGF
ncbi:hypothetical protein OPV22_002377 [Ensete ventricosum]|uniref:COI1 F-box domain-containing protein n=1 Tax=Ensete ventricosum TaxID=4639 RepID=A0AAV8RXT7_ENSVE|nr:hypothetical protein OPV22_002377 [Ensete ventricosum]